jgi:hypothetical protein
MTVFRIFGHTAYCRWRTGAQLDWGVFELAALVNASQTTVATAA